MRQELCYLEPFYHTVLGTAARTMVSRRLETLWPHLEGAEILGCGYTRPFLDRYENDARRIVYGYLGGQGTLPAQKKRGNISVQIVDGQMPFMPAIFDHVLLVHALEETPDLPGFLAELWRVMKPEARIVVIVAHRGGLWARNEHTPFGAGRPFSHRQISSLLNSAGFTTLKRSGALYCPPLARLCSPKLSLAIEKFGETVWPGFSGLILVEAVKRLYAGQEQKKRARIKRPRFAGSGAVGIPGKVIPSHEMRKEQTRR